ncbi:MAG: hypothetical protein EOO40_01720, partial [Deltaproteobacteria bacterium]
MDQVRLTLNLVSMRAPPEGSINGVWQCVSYLALATACLVGSARAAAARLPGVAASYAMTPAVNVSTAASPASLVANRATSSYLTFTFTDASGRPLTGQNVNFASSNSLDLISSSVLTTDCQGQVHPLYAAVSPGKHTLSATLSGRSWSAPLPVTYTCNTFYYKENAVATVDHVQGLAIGDVNEDGRPDVVATGDYDGLMWVHLGNGNGTFAPPSQVAIPVSGAYIGAPAVHLGDLNGDGHLDVVGCTSEANIVSFVGAGDGTFAAAQSFAPQAAVTEMRDVLIGDFDGDGILDVVGTGGGYLSYMRGVGDSTFQAPVLFADAGGRSFGSASADIDLDGDLDVATANINNDSITVTMNLGHGVFGAGTVYPCSSGGGAYSMVAADLNGDGYPDLATAQYYAAAVCTLLNQRDGTMGAANFSNAPGYPNWLVAADLNRDGALDLVASASDDGLQVGLNDGHGGFPATMTVVSDNGFATNTLAVGDLNRDGNVD